MISDFLMPDFENSYVAIGYRPPALTAFRKVMPYKSATQECLIEFQMPGPKKD